MACRIMEINFQGEITKIPLTMLIKSQYQCQSEWATGKLQTVEPGVRVSTETLDGPKVVAMRQNWCIEEGYFVNVTLETYLSPF